MYLGQKLGYTLSRSMVGKDGWLVGLQSLRKQSILYFEILFSFNLYIDFFGVSDCECDPYLYFRHLFPHEHMLMLHSTWLTVVPIKIAAHNVAFTYLQTCSTYF